MLPQTDTIESLDTFFCPYCKKEYFDDYFYPDGKHWVECSCGGEFYMYKETTTTFRTERIFE
jgi:hypothetical protein